MDGAIRFISITPFLPVCSDDDTSRAVASAAAGADNRKVRQSIAAPLTLAVTGGVRAAVEPAHIIFAHSEAALLPAAVPVPLIEPHSHPWTRVWSTDPSGVDLLVSPRGKEDGCASSDHRRTEPRGHLVHLHKLSAPPDSESDVSFNVHRRTLQIYDISPILTASSRTALNPQEAGRLDD